jgi:membrane protein YdbS with pleckstrin-like domain
MFCNKCGQSLPDGSRFCNSCGSQLSVPADVGAAPDVFAHGIDRTPGGVQPRSSYDERTPMDLRDDAAGEQVRFVLRPTLIFVALWYILAGLVVVATAAIMGLLNRWVHVGAPVAFIVIGIVAIAIFSVPVYKHIQRRRQVYTLTNHKLEMRYGLIAKTVRNIPLRNIQDVTVTSTILQRIMGMGVILIDSASESGKIKLMDIHHPERYADMILGELRRRY